MTRPAGPGLSFSHLGRLSDATGLFEHAERTEPRLEHGYCVDDVARGLVVTAREPAPEEATAALAMTYQRFLAGAQDLDGGMRNRLGANLVWQDDAGVEDSWGRALWGLGTAAARSCSPRLAAEALALFEVSAARRSPWTRAMAFAALGAAEVLTIHLDHPAARSLLADAAAMIDPVESAATSAPPEWPWPEERLRYANAVLPETLLAAGDLLGEPRWVARGLALLEWLLATETAGGHLSVTPVGGWARGEPRPAFDQQPIEVAALADACARAHDLTGHPQWADATLQCAAWFEGANDVGIAMVDPVSGGGFDGLEADGRNENQGAESTLAMLSTFQRASRLRVGDVAGRVLVPTP
ncbi:glycosyltransferase [Intrasporangium calvum]|uniref:glycosyltransferase n=1 Tax=Intrasporangium calvum TaxID=53358 RepID=UPI000DF61D66|nr:glycosyltransferase [Intrasporangium calvum]AXG14455.1 glycosyltransferase [Intrasporangium calvum]